MKRITTLFTLLLVLMFQSATSCVNMEFAQGSGNVVTSTRNVSDFNAIKVCCGIDLYISQSDKENVTVETDDNLQEHIKVEVEDRVLNIHKDKLNFVKSKVKVYVTVKELVKIEASSGSAVESNGLIATDMMQVDASSGTDVKLSLKSKYVTCSSSSGSDITLKGTAQVVDMNASSGSDINAKELISETAKANASSGAEISVHATEEIIGEASSGGNIKVAGNPQSKNINKSSGGDVSFE